MRSGKLDASLQPNFTKPLEEAIPEHPDSPHFGKIKLPDDDGDLNEEDVGKNEKVISDKSEGLCETIEKDKEYHTEGASTEKEVGEVHLKRVKK